MTRDITVSKVPHKRKYFALFRKIAFRLLFIVGWAPIQIGVEGFDQVMQNIPGIVWFMGRPSCSSGC